MMRLAWATDVHLNFVSGQQLAAFAKALVADEPGALERLQHVVDLLTDTLLSHLAYEERELLHPLARYGFYR